MIQTVGAVALLALPLACARPTASLRRTAPSEAVVPISRPTGAAAGGSESATSAASSANPTLLITDLEVLAALERQGLSLSALFGGSEPSNRALSGLPQFSPLVVELEREVTRAQAADPLAGVEVARFPHRLFDTRFLRSAGAMFVLAGVVNRPDRAPFANDSCGETRLIYRLSYALGTDRASKLPMTLGVELAVPRGANGCREAVARWLEPPTSGPEARAAWLRSQEGPLSASLTRLRHDSSRVVLNLQLVRWPSTVRPDLGGHAEYLLRAFRPDGEGALRSEPLENTIAPALGSERRRRLEAWLVSNAARVDEGTALLPADLLATRSLSVTPRGLSRLANRPFSSALSPRLEFPERGRFVKSSAGLLRRLDQLSCPGCHQARSVAGFHLLGEDSPVAPPENALALPISPQVAADLPRRLRVLSQMLAGEEPDYGAPFAERAGGGGYGEACGLGDDPTFATWRCDAGLVCSAIEASEGDVVGQCLPAALSVGDACEVGAVRPSADRLRDRMGRVEPKDCPGQVCNRSNVGFPGGMCTAACGSPGSSCGRIAILEPFNACLGRGESFLTCLRGNVRPAGLRACDAESPCRNDYVCARGSAGSGVCLPPYFVFQLRVDGHSGNARGSR